MEILKKWNSLSLIIRILIGLVIGVCGWTLLFNRKQTPAQEEPDSADGQSIDTAQAERDNTDTQKPQ